MKKNVTKALAVVAAVAMVSMTSVSAFAVDGSSTTTSTNANTTVKYTVATSYTWSVPSEITFTADNASVTTGGTTGTTQNVCVTKNVIPHNTKLQITAAGEGDNQEFIIKDSVKKNLLSFAITLGDATSTSTVNPGGVVLEVPASTNSKDTALTFKLSKESVEQAGSYSGTVTYTASVVDVTPAGSDE